MKNVDYSVVIPVYNSAPTLQELFSRIRDVFERAGKSFEIIFVEDCGTDDSWDIIRDLKQQFPQEIIAIRLTQNFGQHIATFCGLDFSNGKNILTIDDDLQLPPEEIPKLIEAFEKGDNDLVYGIFPEKKHSLIRNSGSILLKKITRGLLNAPGEGSSFRIFTAEIARKIVSHHQKFIYIDELLLWYTGNIGFVEVRHDKRKFSKSGYSALKLMKLTYRVIFYASALPLKLMVYGGLSLSLFTFLLGIFKIYRKLFHHVPLGYTSMIVTILFSTSVLLFSLGVIGEYLSRLYEGQNKRSPYLIKKILR